MVTEVELIFGKLREAKKQSNKVDAERSAALKAIAESSDGTLKAWYQYRI
jgi:hypothetical protein